MLWIQTCIPPIFWESTSQQEPSKGFAKHLSNLHQQPPSSLPLLPITILTNYHKFCGLKQHRYIFSYSSGGQKSYSQNACRAALLLEALGENLFPCLFQLPEVFTFLSLWPFTPSLEHITATSASIITSPFLTLTHSSPSYKDPCGGDFLGGPLVKNPPCNVGDVGSIPG